MVGWLFVAIWPWVYAILPTPGDTYHSLTKQTRFFQIQQDWAESSLPPPGAGDMSAMGAGAVSQIPQVEDWSAAPPPTQNAAGDEWKTGGDDWGASGTAAGWN